MQGNGEDDGVTATGKSNAGQWQQFYNALNLSSKDAVGHDPVYG